MKIACPFCNQRLATALIGDANSKNKLGDLKITYKYDSHCAESNNSKNERF
jgi:hypothetical protein